MSDPELICFVALYQIVADCTQVARALRVVEVHGGEIAIHIPGTLVLLAICTVPT